jgi:hypothetical protein
MFAIEENTQVDFETVPSRSDNEELMNTSRKCEFQSRPTVIMPRHELDVLLQVDASFAAREHTKPTVVFQAITPEMVEQYKLRSR